MNTLKIGYAQANINPPLGIGIEGYYVPRYAKGFLDDLLVSQYLDPPLSTMTFQKDLLGQKAMHLLYQIMENQPYNPVNLIKTTPVERGSVKKI